MDDIEHRRIRVSRFRDLNDPFELLAVNNEEMKFRRGLRSWRDKFDKAYGLLCFSRDWHNPVLWSHYADKHRGVCLGSDLSDALIRRVSYVSKRIPQIREWRHCPWLGQGLRPAFAPYEI